MLSMMGTIMRTLAEFVNWQFGYLWFLRVGRIFLLASRRNLTIVDLDGALGWRGLQDSGQFAAR
jgi:hypothetical protein